MRRRMVWELAACFAAVLLLFTAVLGGVYAAAFRRHTVAVNREAMEVQAASIAGTLASFGGGPGMGRGRGGGYGAYLRFLNDLTPAEAWIVDVDRTLLAPGRDRMARESLPAGAGDKGGVVELIDVDIVCIQVSQAGLQVLPQLPARLGVGLGGDYHLVPYACEGIAQLLLAVGVGPGGVKVVYAPVHRLAQEPGGLLFGDALDGQTAKAVFLDLNAGGT